MKLGASFTKHPVIRSALERGIHWPEIIPLALYTDGVQYTKNDSYIGYFVQNLRTGTKMLVCAIRLKLSRHFANAIMQ